MQNTRYHFEQKANHIAFNHMPNAYSPTPEPFEDYPMPVLTMDTTPGREKSVLFKGEKQRLKIAAHPCVARGLVTHQVIKVNKTNLFSHTQV